MRTHIVSIARTWLGTPYHHQASAKGVGTDCIGLVRGIWRELLGPEPQPLPAYTRDWAEAQGRETLLEAARRHLVEIAPAEAQPGDVLIFRWRRTAPAKHCAILSGAAAMIHALEGAPVSEVSLSPWWQRHVAGTFRFPGVDDGVATDRLIHRATGINEGAQCVGTPQSHLRLRWFSSGAAKAPPKKNRG